MNEAYAELVEAIKPYRVKTIDTKPLIVGCKCGKAIVAKEWDDELGVYYCFCECILCNYYWEGPIYT